MAITNDATGAGSSNSSPERHPLYAEAVQRAGRGDDAPQIAMALTRRHGARPIEAAWLARRVAPGEPASFVLDRAWAGSIEGIKCGREAAIAEQAECDRLRSRRRAKAGAHGVLLSLGSGEDFAGALGRRFDISPDLAAEIAASTLRRLRRQPEPPTRQHARDPFAVVIDKRQAGLQSRAIERAFRLPPPPESTFKAPVAAAKVPPTAAPKAEQFTRDSSLPPVRYNALGVRDVRPRLRSMDFLSGVEIAPPSWLVKGLVPKSGLTLLYGESAAGKTFLAILLALSTAWGLPFFGRRVRQSGVVFVAAEAGRGVLSRFIAAEKHFAPLIEAENRARAAKGLSPLVRAPISVITEAPDLGPDGTPNALIATIDDKKSDMADSGHRLGLVVVDTWHAALGGGDDNSSADTGGALRPLRELCDAHGLATMVVHHPGKDSEKGARGSSALPAAADAIIALVVEGHTGPKAKPSSATRRLTVTKMRDGECGIEATYRLAVVELGPDEDGDPWTTCVVEPLSEAKEGEAGLANLTSAAREVLDDLSAAAATNSAGWINLDSARQRFVMASKRAKPEAAESTHRMAWDRALKKLRTTGRIEVFADENRIQILDP